MTVITYAALVVIPYNTLAFDDIRQTIFVVVLCRQYGRRNAPNSKLRKSVNCQNNAATDEWDCLHVRNDANNRDCCQLLQHINHYIPDVGSKCPRTGILKNCHSSRNPLWGLP